jgi:cytochrome c
MKVIIASSALAALLVSPAAYAGGDPVAGKAVFAKCAICHSTQPGKTMIGPSLFGVVGRHSASIDGYSYSEAMKKADKTWDEATLDVYLTDPKAMVP